MEPKPDGYRIRNPAILEDNPMANFEICLHYRTRKLAELQAARCATDPGIRCAHTTMAHHYAELIRMAEFSYA